MPFIYENLKKTQGDLRAGVITCREVIQHYLQTIDEKKHLNAFLEVFGDEALERADAIDQKIKSGKTGKLFGLVVGVKDVICMKGKKVTASSKILDDFESLYNATVIASSLSSR